MPPVVNIRNVGTGERRSATPEEARQIVAAEPASWVVETTSESNAATIADQRQRDYSTFSDKVDALGGQAASIATFGGTDLLARSLGGADAAREERWKREANPGSTFVGTLIGLAPSVLTGGEGAVGALARATPAGAASRLGAAIARTEESAGLASRVARGAAGAVAEGGIYSAGTAMSGTALADDPPTIENIAGSMSHRFLTDAPINAIAGGALSAAEHGLLRVRRNMTEAAKDAERAASAAPVEGAPIPEDIAALDMKAARDAKRAEEARVLAEDVTPKRQALVQDLAEFRQWHGEARPWDALATGSKDARDAAAKAAKKAERAAKKAEARVAELEAELKRMATEFPGVLPDPEQAQWNADEAERQTLLADIKAWDDRQAKLAEFVARDSNASPAYSAPIVLRRVEDIYDMAAIRSQSRSLDEVEQRTRENALRSIESAARSLGSAVDFVADIVENRDEGEEGKGEIARRVLLTGSPAYKRAFNKYLKNQTALWTAEESRAAALAVTGTTTTGGYAVPYVFDPTIIRIGAWTAVNPFRAACRVETITNGNNWRTVTVGAITAGYGTEGLAASEGGPTFGQPSYTVQKAQAFATVSIETLEDRPDITSELTAAFAEAKDTEEENKFAVGTGLTVYPLGMFTDTAYTNQDTATNDTTAIADMKLLEAALPLRHRARAAFFMSRSTQRQLEALDTTGYYFKQTGQNFAMGMANPANGSPIGLTGSTLLGYPIWEVPSGPSTLTTDGAIIVIFADPRSYVIVDRLGMNVEVIPHLTNGATPSFPTGQRGVYMYWRNTAKPINADAGRSLSVQ